MGGGRYHPAGNYQQKGWEYPAYIQFFETNGDLAFAGNVGISIHGIIGGYPLKSIRISARKEYGISRISYAVFPDRDLKSYKRLVLRYSGGDDFRETYFRDGLIQTLVSDLDIEVQSFRPSILFINGEYWGIHNLREKYDKHYFKSHFNLLEDEFDLIDACGSETIKGSNQGYKDLIAYINANDIRDKQVFDTIANQIDIDNYIVYHLIELFFANYDWPGGNMKMWRPSAPGGKWRWLLFDLDYSMGHQQGKVEFNSIRHATVVESDTWSNYKCSTFLLRALLKNGEFRKKFVCTYLTLQESHLNHDVISEKVDEFHDKYRKEIMEHIQRWNYPVSYKKWERSVRVMKIFAEKRNEIFEKHMEDYLGKPLDEICD